MNDLPPVREALIAQIGAAFPDPGYPADREVCACDCPTCEGYRQDMRGSRWRDLAEAYDDAANAYCLIDRDALAYFLPALMTIVLRDPEAAELTLEFSIYTLTPRDFVVEPEVWSVFEGYGTRPRAAVYAYLDWALGHMEALLSVSWEGERGSLQALIERYPV